MKKSLALLAALLLCLQPLAPAAAMPAVRAYLLMDYQTGQILIGHNIDQPLPPASITKLMTMYLVFEALAEGQLSLSDRIRTSPNASGLPAGSSTIFLGHDEALTVEELLLAVAIISANDAGLTLAEHIAGSEAAFVEMMNNKARELGLEATHFVNSHGLDAEGHVMSARDIAILSRAAIRDYPEILAYSAIPFLRLDRDTRYIRAGYFDLVSTFRPLIGWRNLDGLKTGWTSAAKRGITATAEEDGRRYIAVVLGADDTTARDQLVRHLLNQGFDHYTPRIPYTAGEVIDTIVVDQGKVREVDVALAEDLILVMAKDSTLADYQLQKEYMPHLQAPLDQGDKVGELIVLKDGETMARIDLVSAQAVERANLVVRSLRLLSKAVTLFGDWLAQRFL